MTLRFSPYHPNQVLQTSEMEIALKETQTRFYALDLKNAGHDFSIDDGFNLLKLHVKEAENDGALRYIASTYDPYDQIIRDGLYPGGRKVKGPGRCFFISLKAALLTLAYSLRLDRS